MELTRRDSFSNRRLAAATAFAAHSALPPDEWFDRLMRWAQLTPAEDDPEPDLPLPRLLPPHPPDAACPAPAVRRLLPHRPPIPQPVARLHPSASWSPDAANSRGIACTDPRSPPDVVDAHPD